jgi:hypothetical protein
MSAYALDSEREKAIATGCDEFGGERAGQGVGVHRMLACGCFILTSRARELFRVATAKKRQQVHRKGAVTIAAHQGQEDGHPPQC